jgi:hypothetical protein
MTLSHHDPLQANVIPISAEERQQVSSMVDQVHAAIAREDIAAGVYDTPDADVMDTVCDRVLKDIQQLDLQQLTH